MQFSKPFTRLPSGLIAAVLWMAGVAGFAQPASPAREPLNWTTQQDHKHMMEQLGIQRLRPGPSGNVTATNAANYDPAKANPYPDLPDPLVLNNGQTAINTSEGLQAGVQIILRVQVSWIR